MNALFSKILYLTPGCFDKGGISRYCRYQIDALREIAGEENVRVLSILGPSGEGFETPFNVTWHGDDAQASNKARFKFSLRAVLLSVVWRPTVIHSAHVNLSPLASRLAALSGGTTVLNVYGLEIWSGLNAARRAHMARMDHIIADCHATAEHVVSDGMHLMPPTTIWDCADLERFSPGPPPAHLVERYGIPDMAQSRIVLTLGRLAVAARHKGYDRLIELWGAVRAQVKDAHLVIAGSGDDLQRLSFKAKALGLAECVTFTGAVDEEDLPGVYRSAHVFTLVSDKGPGRGEGIPLTPIEALASGIPVVVGNEDGSREAVDGSRNGFVVSPRNPAEIIEALVTLLSEVGEVRGHRVAEARSVAEERFGFADFVEKHRKFYCRLRDRSKSCESVSQGQESDGENGKKSFPI